MHKEEHLYVALSAERRGEELWGDLCVRNGVYLYGRRKLRTDVSSAVSLNEVIVSSTPVLALGSKLLGQVSSVRCVACPKA